MLIEFMSHTQTAAPMSMFCYSKPDHWANHPPKKGNNDCIS